MSSSKSSSRDFSFFSLFTAGLACLVPFANAYTKPVGAEPSGNPIYQPGLNSIVPVGENFTVTWDPTTLGTVTLVLLKGPSTNAVPQYAIAEKIPNSGSYIWFPSTDLAPDDTGYGIQLIDDKTGAYQYTTQFGISNPDYNPAAVSTSSASSQTTSASKTTSTSATASASVSKSASVTTTAIIAANGTSAVYYTTEVVSQFTTYCPYATSLTLGNHTYTVSSATTLTVTDCPCTITKPYTTAPAGPITTTAVVVVASTGGLPANGSIIYPTGSMTVPSSLSASATGTGTGGAASATASSTAPIQANTASGVATSFVGLVVAAGVAVFAL
ncbi:hypothetical protein LTR53_016915 [Teratosphaeriaceae sp. CCFEE 6253]|nr:hypothetical protein LTR53_016915 [Teratosphaeriaceae sp. CCFEE 6253]